MGAYRDAADRLREEFRCAVIIIHHCGIDATRPRGHSSLTGAVDELGLDLSWSELVTTDVFNSNKCFAVFTEGGTR